MASSTIDALFSLTPRAAEPVRGPEAAPFDPALRQALAPRRPAEQPPASASTSEEPEAVAEAEPEVGEAADDGAHDRQADEAGEIQSESAVVKHEPDGADDAESAEDETEISADAAAALAAVEAKTAGRDDAVAKAEVVVSVAAAEDAAAKQNDGSKENAAAATDEAAIDAPAPLPATNDADDREAIATEFGEREPLNKGRDKQVTDNVEDVAAANNEAGTRPVETRSKRDADQAAEPVAEDKSAAKASPPTEERSEKRIEVSDRAEAKQATPSTSLNAAVEPVITESSGGATAEAPADRPIAKTDALPAAVATSSESRTAASLEKLAGARGVLPAVAEVASAEGGAPVDRARFVQRVEGALRRAQDRDGRLHVRLSPPELGSLRVEIAVHNGVLTAKLEAETTAARNLIMENLPALRERLAQQDVRIERFDVDVRRDGGGSGGSAAGGNGAGEQFAERSAWREDLQRGRSGSTGAARVEMTPAAKPQADALGLDVRV